MTSVITLLAFADCGLGFGLMNDVAYCLGRDRQDAARRAISSTFFVLVAVGVGGCILFALAYPLIPWKTIFRTRGLVETREVSRAVAVIVAGFLLTLPFTTVQRVQYAHQEGFKSQAWEIGGVVLSLIGLMGAIWAQASLPVLAIVFTAGPLLALVLNWMDYFLLRRPTEMPAFGLFDAVLARRIAREGAYFFILQLGAILVFSVDSLIVLHYYGQAACGRYSLVAKLFQVTPAFAGVWFAALWPAYAEAIARGDGAWVKSTLRRSTMICAAGCAVVSVPVAALAHPAIRLWAGVDTNPSGWLLTGFVLYSAISAGTGAVAAYLNGSSFIRGQAVLVIVVVAAAVCAKIVLCKYWDIAGAVWGTNLSFLAIVIPAYCVIVPKLLGNQWPLGKDS
jgi:O-antigen/teichoic acid export membrane protein